MDYKQIEKVVNKYDPIGLISMGMPQDEYSPEIKELQNSIKMGQKQEEIEKIVIKIFEKWFFSGFSHNNDYVRP